MEDDEWNRHKRSLRWQALHEDEAFFGLTPAEEAELAALDREFGSFTREASEP